MASAADIYAGILKPGKGGIFEPGPPVMLPPHGMGSRRDTAALAKALIDPAGDGPNWSMLDDQVSGDMYPIRSMAEMGGSSIPSASGTLLADKGQDRLTNTPSPLLAFNGDQATGTPAQKAIDIEIHGGGNPLLSGLAAIGGAASPQMQWQPAQADPSMGQGWQQYERLDSSAQQQPGMVTGARPRGLAAVQRPKPSGLAAVSDSGPGRFLREQGVDTKGMTAGQLANAFNKAIF